MKVLSPMKAIRATCLDCCGGSPKSVTWCTLDGLHSTRCGLWPFRFGMRPETFAERFGPALVTPSMMPPANVNEDSLPLGLEEAAKYLADLNGTTVPARKPLTAVQAAGAERLRQARLANAAHATLGQTAVGTEIDPEHVSED
jgi:hypothetical protein